MVNASAALQAFNLALAYQGAGMLDEAVASYRQALALQPDFAEAHCNLGVVLENQRKFAEAACCYRSATALRPELAQPWFNLGHVLQEQGQWAEAASCYREVLRREPSYVTAHNNLGVVLYQQRLVDEAIDCFKAAVAWAPDYVDALRNLAQGLGQQGHPEQAIHYYEQVLRIAPGDCDALKRRAFLRESQTAARLLSEERTPAQLREIVDDALAFADENNAPFVEGRRTLACQKGCSWCCKLQVTVTAPEALRIAGYLQANLSADGLAELRTRLKELVAKTAGMGTEERAVSGLPCGLLVDNACSVYPVRPLICRGWNSTDASVCEEATKRPDVRIQCFAPQRAVYDGTETGLIAGLGRAGYLDETYDLCAAVLIALELPHAAEDWLAGEPILASAMRRSFHDDSGRISLL